MTQSHQSYAELLGSLDVDMRLRKAIARMGIVKPTLVQEQCLDLAIAKGRDIVCKARTGSGKTLAYLVPICHKIIQKSEYETSVGVQAVVLVPTKELVAQVYNVVQELTYYCNRVVTCIKLGTASTKQEAAMLRDTPSIVVATPAGLLKHVKNGSVVLKESVQNLVIDEADLILSFGYSQDVTELVKSLPKICQGFLMSATLSAEVDRLKAIVLHSPAILKLEEEHEKEKSRKVGKLMQFYLSLPLQDKQLVLYVFLKLGLLKGKGLFFVNKTDTAYRLKLFFEQFHIQSAVLNAELPLQSRMSIIEGFNAGNFDYLIATEESMNDGSSKITDDDIDEEDEDEKNDDTLDEIDKGNSSNMDDDAKRTKKKRKKTVKETRQRKDSEYGVSRGLDFRGVSFVVNVDMPLSPESYTHRIGRTARGGASGVALSLVDEKSDDELDMLTLVQEMQPTLPVPAISEELTAASMDENPIELKGQPQPSPLQFDLKEIEGFRYRVEDVSRAVTKVAIRETRIAELRAELLNSERLKKHFEDNPQDLQLLRHDRQATHVSKVKSHLKNVPNYLLPRGMQVANLSKRRKRRRTKKNNSAARRTDNDPLQSFEGSTDLEGVALEEGEVDVFADEPSKSVGRKSDVNNVSRIYMDVSETGRSTSGRRAWKVRHKKGKKRSSLAERS